MLFGQAGEEADPEGSAHNGICSFQRRCRTVADLFKAGLTRHIAGKEQASADFVGIEVLEQIFPVIMRIEGQQIAEPGGIAAGGRPGQLQRAAIQCSQLFTEQGEIASARSGKVIQAFELLQSHGGLHVSDLEVIAQMRIDVFVIVPLWQQRELPLKTSFAAVVPARGTPAVPAPVPQRKQNLAQQGVITGNGPPSPIVMWCAG